ncbi:MAG TPA: aminotransferase class I/II-fold pyridoxal phosphate-dependent enzyme [Desulfobacteria bacterium]|nr:aminotransferase class I/II-fold pyridoxal phosphate-dependent enzyme [Desulfobacteria bacterium]
MKSTLPLLEGILTYLAKDKLSFHTPGHKDGKGLVPRDLDFGLGRLDLTEVPGLDNLHNPMGIIAAAQEQCARWNDAAATFFLVNGATVGIEAALLATLKPGDQVLVPRNAHKSVVAGLVLTGAKPVYYFPEIHPEFGLALGQNPQRIIERARAYPGSTAIVSVYPTYYGTIWPLEKLRDSLKLPLIVDEAHGAHFSLSKDLPASSLSLGADVVVQSTHKTIGALTQGATLHIGKDSRIPCERISEALSLLQTSSPSYPIMLSIESAIWQSQQKQTVWAQLAEGAVALKQRLRVRGIRVLDDSDVGNYAITGVDPTKILLRAPTNMAPAIARQLSDGFGIEPELWDKDNILFLLGVGDDAESLRRLEDALYRISWEGDYSRQKFTLPQLPEQVLTPREAYFSDKRLVQLTRAKNMIAASSLAPYPPGIPVIVPGERLTKELVDYISNSLETGVNWQGIDSKRRISVVKEKQR